MLGVRDRITEWETNFLCASLLKVIEIGRRELPTLSGLSNHVHKFGSLAFFFYVVEPHALYGVIPYDDAHRSNVDY